MRPRAADFARWWHHAPSGQVIVDEQGLILQANQTLSDWMALPVSYLYNRPASELFTPEARMLYLGLLAYRVAEDGAADEVHLTLRVEGDAPLPVLCSARQMTHQSADLVLLSMLPIARKDSLERELIQARQEAQLALEEKNAVIAELKSVRSALESQREELKSLTMRLGHEARSDALTGLPNRCHFDSVLQQLLLTLAVNRGPASLSVALLDVDHFKPVNDQYGHAVGDRVLQQLAQLLSSQLRGRDLAARIGGEEFALLMPDTSHAEASVAMDRLRRAIEIYPWQPVPITVSIGLTSFRAGDTQDSLMARADAALYSAKHQGRNRVAKR